MAGVLVAHGTRRRWRPLAASGAILLAAATAVTLWHLRPREAPAPRVVLLSAMRRVLGVSFSPDGTQIVFSSTGDAGDNLDIWLKLVGEDEGRRLTTDPAADDDPAWSPDGRQIAFVRYAEDGGPGAVYLVSPLGGAERRLTDFPAYGRPSWSPDARWLAVGRAPGPNTLAGMGIWVVAVGSGEAHQVTFAKPSAWDMAPAFSPDGRALAYTSCEGGQGAETCNVWTRSLDPEVRPQGEPRRLTEQGGVFPAWTRDGRSIIYALGTYGVSRLWRVHADGSTPPERVELAGPGATYPATVRCCDRLAYLRDRSDTDIYRIELGTRATPVIASTFWDFNPQYSPDGRQIAFESIRADERFEVWLADADGSNVTRLTRGPGSMQGTARWSPDGRRIAFDSQPEGGRQDIWTINVDGSGLRQVTRDPADECMPSWSRDGKFLYYGSNRTGRYEIWRIAVTGGPEEQVTQAGGFLPFESLDGRILYYLRQRGGELLARPTAGGPERSIVSCIDTWAYAVGPQGVFHIDCAPPETPAGTLRALRSWDPVTGKDREVAALDVGDGNILGLSASPDGRSLIYSRYTYAYDLMMIENFR